MSEQSCLRNVIMMQRIRAFVCMWICADAFHFPSGNWRCCLHSSFVVFYFVFVLWLFSGVSRGTVFLCFMRTCLPMNLVFSDLVDGKVLPFWFSWYRTRKCFTFYVIMQKPHRVSLLCCNFACLYSIGVWHNQERWHRAHACRWFSTLRFPCCWETCFSRLIIWLTRLLSANF